MSTTLDVIADRARSILTASPFEFQEAETPFSFDLQPDSGIDRGFRIVDGGANRIVGGFGYSETRVDRLQIWVARKFNGDATAAKRLLTRDMHSITAAIVRDGHQVSGEYAVADEGRLHELRADQGAEYAVLQMTVPVDYESQL